MRNYYLEESIEHLLDEDCENEEEAIKAIEMYFSGFSWEEKLELMIRGQIHAREDKRTNGYFDR